MRTVRLDRQIEDVSGLYFELILAEFEVVSISVRDRSTIVTLEDEEEKDPLLIMESFVGVPLKAPSKSTLEERREIYRKFCDEKRLRMENLRARFRVSQEVRAIAREAQSKEGYESSVALLEDHRPEVLALPPAPKKGWLQKIKDMI